MADTPKLPPMTRDELYALLLDNAGLVINGVIDGLAALGSSQDDWDSESIEILLGRIEEPLKQLRIPGIGNTNSDWDAHVFWYRVENGEDPADPDDPYSGNDEDARTDWKYEVATGDTELGFKDWWGQQIETARDNGGRHA